MVILYLLGKRNTEGRMLNKQDFDLIIDFKWLNFLLKFFAVSWHFLVLLYYKYCEEDLFYFEEYEKTLTICKDGHGIILNKFKVRVLNPKNLTCDGNHFERYLLIDDADKNTKFPLFRDMCDAQKQKRFSDFGFWYKPKHIIKAKYNRDKSKERQLYWFFSFENSSLKDYDGGLINKPISIEYAISIPKIFPIEDGFFDSENNPLDTKFMTSSLTVKDKIRIFKYTVAFEDGIQLNGINFIETNQGRVKKLNFTDNSDIFYKRYTKSVNNPKKGRKISVQWSIMDKEAQGET
jgi:hypothetical protein